MTVLRQHRLAAAVLGLAAAILALIPVLDGGQTSRGAEPEVRLGSDTPVVLIVLDELPNANLMTANARKINARRFPRIASLASTATWYRDNVAAGDFTAWAVPGILTGNSVNELTLPTAEAQPDNLFTLFGPGREVHSLETVTELCPVEICPDGHQGEAPEAEHADDFIKAKFKPFAPAEVKEWIEGIPAGPGTLSFAHVEVPHAPLRFLPSGQAYKPGPLIMPTDLTQNGWTTREPAVAFAQHRHLLQTGYADRMVGHIIRKIRQNGDFDDAMIVLTADHGISFDPDDLRRDVTPGNVGATVNPPLIIKYPGQTEGVVSTASTQSLDIVPTIAEQLGAGIPSTDGMPVGDAGPDRVMTVSRDQMRQILVTAEDIRTDRREALADQVRRLGTRDLWHLGPRNGLIGRRPGKVRTLSGSRYGLYVTEARIRKADRSSNMVPALISGRLAGVGAGQLIALAWNGKVVATTRSFEFQGRIQFGAMVPPTAMRRGRNRIAVFVAGPGDILRRVPRA
ncbi:MAG: sulfatase-like hydrolase/transferase [Solirubrobacterales bacterium]|nr:sulfatase-like hydrolase/transferase [Solirubrobacterales bacterium]